MDLRYLDSDEIIGNVPFPSSRPGLFGFYNKKKNAEAENLENLSLAPNPAGSRVKSRPESNMGESKQDSEFSIQTGSGILNDEIAQEIDDLSESDDSDYEDMPFDKLINKLLQPNKNYVLPRVTKSELEATVKGKDAYKQLAEYADYISPTWRKYLGEYHGVYVQTVDTGSKKMFSYSIKLYDIWRYLFALFIMVFVCIVNSFQLTVENAHRCIIRSDTIANSLLDDRSEESRYAPTIDNDSNVDGNDSNINGNDSNNNDNDSTTGASLFWTPVHPTASSSKPSLNSRRTSSHINSRTSSRSASSSVKKANKESKPQNTAEQLIDELINNELYKKQEKRNKSRSSVKTVRNPDDPDEVRQTVVPVQVDTTVPMFKNKEKHFWRGK